MSAFNVNKQLQIDVAVKCIYKNRYLESDRKTSILVEKCCIFIYTNVYEKGIRQPNEKKLFYNKQK